MDCRPRLDAEMGRKQEACLASRRMCASCQYVNLSLLGDAALEQHFGAPPLDGAVRVTPRHQLSLQRLYTPHSFALFFHQGEGGLRGQRTGRLRGWSRTKNDRCFKGLGSESLMGQIPLDLPVDVIRCLPQEYGRCFPQDEQCPPASQTLLHHSCPPYADQTCHQ